MSEHGYNSPKWWASFFQWEPGVQLEFVHEAIAMEHGLSTQWADEFWADAHFLWEENGRVYVFDDEFTLPKLAMILAGHEVVVRHEVPLVIDLIDVIENGNAVPLAIPRYTLPVSGSIFSTISRIVSGASRLVCLAQAWVRRPIFRARTAGRAIPLGCPVHFRINCSHCGERCGHACECDRFFGYKRRCRNLFSRSLSWRFGGTRWMVVGAISKKNGYAGSAGSA
jgi:hypothetical protein